MDMSVKLNLSYPTARPADPAADKPVTRSDPRQSTLRKVHMMPKR